jgi:hypothetical protein
MGSAIDPEGRPPRELRKTIDPQHLVPAYLREESPLMTFRRSSTGPCELSSRRRGGASPSLTCASLPSLWSRDATLVTGNTRRFTRVTDLRVANWLAHGG